MDMESTERRTVPPALVIGLALPMVWSLARVLILSVWKPEHGGYVPRLILIGEGVSFAMSVLMLSGTLELARRMTGRARVGLNIALAGAAIAFAADLLVGLVQFTAKPWDHRWVWKVYDYVGSTSMLAFAIGFVLVLPAARRVLGLVAVAIVFVTWPVDPVRTALFGWMDLGRDATMYFELTLRLLRYGTLLALAIVASRGTTTTDVYAASAGFRLAARALWLRVIAAVCVVLLTLMLVAGGGRSGVELFRFAMISQGIVTIAALTMFGVGALRVAGSSVAGLSATTLVIGGGASLWAAGVSVAQLPYLYKMLYKTEETYMRSGSMEWAQALATAMPIVVIVGVALLATALSGLAARRGNEDLRTSAQGNGVGFVALMLVAVAIQTWMVPKAESASSFAMLALMAAAAGLWATVLMAKLLARGADVVEEEPGLPLASIVNLGAGPSAPSDGT
jgi:hypothetical protein